MSKDRSFYDAPEKALASKKRGGFVDFILFFEAVHGSLRFFLATLVVLSHLGHSGPLNVGVSAVVIFYMLSGYVVTNLLLKHFPPGRLFAFYLERLLRIYPLYLLFLIVVSVFLVTTGFGPPRFTFFKLLSNLTIIPLNYFMFADVFVVKDSCILPPAWSLGAELQAYLLLPFVIRSVQVKWVVGLLSLGIFSVAAYGWLDPDVWSYRLLPGILFIFLSGSAIAKTLKAPKACDTFDQIFPTVCWVGILLLLLLLTVTYHLELFPISVMLGFLIGMPILLFTSRSPVRIPFDSMLGRISYGLFLIHVPVSWLFQYAFGGVISKRSELLFVMIVSVSLSAVATLTIERTVWSLRKAITKS